MTDRDRHNAALAIDDEAEKRATPRRRLYFGEGFRVRIRHGDVVLDGEAVDVSGNGIGVALPSREGAPEAGDEVELTYRVDGFRDVELAAVVMHTTSAKVVGRSMTRLGLRFLIHPSSRRMRVGEHRKHPRFACPSSYPAMASASSPLFFREWMHLRVLDLSAGGVTVLASSALPELVRGAEMALRLDLPIIGSVDVDCRIASVRVGQRGVRVGMSFTSPTPEAHAAIAEYLLIADKSLSPARLRKAGFAVTAMERSVRFDYAHGKPDRDAILELRLAAHTNEGRWEGMKAADTASRFDAYARHIVGRFGDRIVACGRVIFVEGDPSRSEYITKGGHVVPDWLWKAGFCESGANAVDPEFQRTDLYVALLRHAVRVAMQSGVRYVLGASPPHLVPAYLKLGCTALEVREVSPKPGWTFTSTLMLIDVSALETSPNGTVFDSVFRFVAARDSASPED